MGRNEQERTRSAMSVEALSEREQQILQAVIRTFVETAEPAGSRTLARRFDLGVSPATIRNTMADLEEKGFLSHPHTSAGRMPTDMAYRYYVDALMKPVQLSVAEWRRLRHQLEEDGGSALERLVWRAAQAMGLLTGELGLAISPRMNEVVLEKLELAGLSSEKVLLILTLRNGLVRTVYVDLTLSVPQETLASLAMILNERLAGQALSEIRATLPERLRDVVSGDDPCANELLNIFLQSADEFFDVDAAGDGELLLGHASVLANQPEFASPPRLRSLIELTEKRDLLMGVLQAREHDRTLKITIGSEHERPELNAFTLVTSEYRLGGLKGVIGVIGPTRMPYDKVAAIVENTSLLVTELMGADAAGPENELDTERE